MALDALICYVLAVMAMYVLFVAIDCQVVDLSDETLTGDLRLINTPVQHRRDTGNTAKRGRGIL